MHRRVAQKQFQHVYNTIRYYSESKGGSGAGDAMTRRLEQLAEEARPIKDDPKAGPQHHTIVDQIDGRAKLYQKEIGNTKLPSYVSKHSRQIAESPEWQGDVSGPDQVLRDKVDSNKLKNNEPLKPMKKSERKLSHSQRFAQAREKTLDYQLDKHAEETGGPTFRELYNERFSLGGGTGTMASIDSIASQKIEEAISQGKFKNIPRGKKSEFPQYNAPMVDQTEYLLNEMIKKQGAAPPWIQKQNRVNFEVNQFRNELQQAWISYVSTKVGSIKQLEQRIKLALEMDPTEWENEVQKYHQIKLKNINDTIRGYNLQAPLSARRGYLELRDELEKSYKIARESIPTVLRNHVDPPQPTVHKNLHTAKDLYREDPSNYYGFMDLCRDMFKRKR